MTQRIFLYSLFLITTILMDIGCKTSEKSSVKVRALSHQEAIELNIKSEHRKKVVEYLLKNNQKFAAAIAGYRRSGFFNDNYSVSFTNDEMMLQTAKQDESRMSGTETPPIIQGEQQIPVEKTREEGGKQVPYVDISGPVVVLHLTIGMNRVPQVTRDVSGNLVLPSVSQYILYKDDNGELNIESRQSNSYRV